MAGRDAGKDLFIPSQLCPAGEEVRMMLDPVGRIAPSQVLVRAILKAHRFNDQLVQGRLRALRSRAGVKWSSLRQVQRPPP
jgi:hypothetical protein